ncbi:hypothetical protein [Kitasatospora sp. NPDC056531]|uniref:hypothetical protein n=1 Tax=Kitasatospora sp. NPDC056531 TaxID=3345856 RepID=UPI0036918737
MTEPDYYQFHSSHGHHAPLHVVWMPLGPGGLSSFEYADSTRSHTFRGKDVSVVESPLGRVVSVTIETTIDRGSTSFSVLVPSVNLNGHSATVSTVGITTVHRIGIGPMTGQLDVYSETPLIGTAESRIIPLEDRAGAGAARA